MTETYVTLQTQLYALQPDLQSGVRRAPGNWKAASRAASAKNLPQQIARILQKLERLKADILFDPYEAEQKWTETRNKLAQAAAERKRLHLHSEDRSAASRNDHNHVTSNGGNQLNEASKDCEEDGGVEALGEFFSGLPDTPPSGYDDHLISDAEGKEPESRAVVLKNFGKWNGVNPRRTFEEACKARSDVLLGSRHLIGTDHIVKGCIGTSYIQTH